MATLEMESCVDQIGATAGLIWHLLSETGPVSMTRLVKEVDAPRDMVMQAVGWLAREDKVEIHERNRSRIVSLR